MIRPHLILTTFCFANALLYGGVSRAEDPFPKVGILPKEETGAERFLARHAEYDGRGVVVAIFDTGVDPGAAGLQTTSDGRPKIVDMVDGSGSGDVATSVVRKVKDGELEGLTGRMLKTSADWNNPTGDFHVGWKRGYELYPKQLLPRAKRKRKEAWDQQQRELETRLREELIAWDAQSPDDDSKAEHKRRRAELSLRLEVLKSAQKTYQDPGPIYDCVVFHDGEAWQAAIDTDEDGDLGDEKLMTNYRAHRQYATFDDLTLMNFAVNIYDEGNLLSIVTDCGWHGTHVAGIVAGNFPEQPELNGVAPGAQIVSVKIGDSRIGSSSTGTGEVRGLIAVLQNKCDLINMSYGGGTSDPNAGRIVSLYSEIVNKHNVIFVASAGNSGPALTTTVSPGGSTSAILGVGAYASPALMKTAYSQLKEREELPYTWTSRGPTADGDLGVDIAAPGGAISPVSNWSLDKYLLANGTSMSSPNACGGVALLLSGLKAEGQQYTPGNVKRALKNTARTMEDHDPFALGAGLIQIDKAYDYLTENVGKPAESVRFEVDLPARNKDRGIYLRDALEAERVLETEMRVRPRFRDGAKSEEKSRFEMRFQLAATVDWIEAPEHLLMAHGGRSFGIRVDPTNLEPGVHFGEVLGFDADHRDRGPLFRLPVTVVRCQETTPVRESWKETIRFEPGGLARRFFHVPPGATWFDLRIRAGESEASRRLVIHAMQRLPRRGYGRGFQRAYIDMSPGSEVVRSYPVVAGSTLELCLGQYWSSLGQSEFELELKFHGIQPDQQRQLVLDGGLLSTRVELTSPLRDERLAPSAEFDRVRQPISPVKAEIRPLLSARDELPESRRIYELLLTYKIGLPAAAKVRLRLAALQHDELYGEYESRLYQLFDVNKRLLATGGGELELEKGEYVVRFHLRNDRPEMLKKLEGTLLLFDRKLKKPVKLTAHGDPDEVIAGGSLQPRRLEQGERVVMYLRHPADKDLPADLKPGARLLGSLSFGQDPAPRAGVGKRPGGYALQYVVSARTTSPKKEETPPAKSADEAKPDDFLLDAMIAQLEKLRQQKDRDAFQKLAERVLKEHRNNLKVLVIRLHFLDDDDRKQRLPDVVKAADAIIRRISQKKLALHFGARVDVDDLKSMKIRREMETRRSTLTDALYRKGRAIAYMDLPATPGQEPMEVPKFPKKRAARDRLFENNYAQLSKWVDMTDSQYVLLNIRRERRRQRYGHALQLLEKTMKSSPFRKLLFKKRADIYGELGWDVWREHELKWKIIRFPQDYPPF